MSVQVKIIIDDKEINVLWFSFGYHKNADSDGKPTTQTAFLGLRVAIETQKTLNLARWAFAPNQTKQIELHIYPVLMGGRTRKLKLYDCHLLKWSNRFRAEGTQPMHEVLHISAGGVKDNNSRTEYSAPWRKTFDVEYVEPTKPTEDILEPTFLGYHFEDENGNLIEQSKIKYNQKIYLIIETENSEGETITINLDDDRLDYKYNGQIAENDTLRGIAITGEETMIQLIAVKQQNT